MILINITAIKFNSQVDRVFFVGIFKSKQPPYTIIDRDRNLLKT